MKKVLITGMAVAMLAVPSVASAAGGYTGVSTNGTSNDAVGYCISAGNVNIREGEHSVNDVVVKNRGEWNRNLAHTYEGGVGQAIKDFPGCVAETVNEIPYVAPGQVSAD
jgi:hypothetical protein